MLRLADEAIVLLTTTHLIIGALMLAASVVITLRAYRLSRPRGQQAPAKVLTEQYSV